MKTLNGCVQVLSAIAKEPVLVELSPVDLESGDPLHHEVERLAGLKQHLALHPEALQSQASSRERLRQALALDVQPVDRNPPASRNAEHERVNVELVHLTGMQRPVQGGYRNFQRLIADHAMEGVAQADARRGATLADIPRIPVQHDARGDRHVQTSKAILLGSEPTRVLVDRNMKRMRPFHPAAHRLDRRNARQSPAHPHGADTRLARGSDGVPALSSPDHLARPHGPGEVEVAGPAANKLLFLRHAAEEPHERRDVCHPAMLLWQGAAAASVNATRAEPPPKAPVSDQCLSETQDLSSKETPALLLATRTDRES